MILLLLCSYEQHGEEVLRGDRKIYRWVYDANSLLMRRRWISNDEKLTSSLSIAVLTPPSPPSAAPTNLSPRPTVSIYDSKVEAPPEFATLDMTSLDSNKANSLFSRGIFFNGCVKKF
jgi:hypothetical protein